MDEKSNCTAAPLLMRGGLTERLSVVSVVRARLKSVSAPPAESAVTGGIWEDMSFNETRFQSKNASAMVAVRKKDLNETFAKVT